MIPDNLANSMNRAGIVASYHDRRFEEFGPQGAALKTWLIDNVSRVKSGEKLGSIVFTDDIQLFTMMARGLLVYGKGIRIVSVNMLREGIALGRLDDIVHEWFDPAIALFIRGFIEIDTDPIWQYGWERARVEEFLIERIETVPVFLQSSEEDLSRSPWSRELLKLVSNSLTEVIVR
jgi:hypothetical protein